MVHTHTYNDMKNTNHYHPPLSLSLSPCLALIHQKLLSKTVADAFAYFGDPSTSKTQRFVLMFDRLFDCLNVRNYKQWKEKRKPDLKPYSSADDEKLKVGGNFMTEFCVN